MAPRMRRKFADRSEAAKENYKKFSDKILARKLDDTIDLSSLFINFDSNFGL